MKYFLDTEFIEGFHKPLFGKRRHFIDLISIGIVCEDGREYYAISTEFNRIDADAWVKENVLYDLPQRHVGFYDSPRMKAEALLYKSNKQIAADIIEFCKSSTTIDENAPNYIWPGGQLRVRTDPEFYGYYCVAPETKVLTRNLKWVQAGLINNGDRLVGFEESGAIGKSRSSKWRKWKTATVLGNERIMRPCYDLAFDDGTKVVCSEDHRWLTYNQKAASWLTTKALACSPMKKSSVVKLIDVWQEDRDYDAGYIAAAFDGEGYLTQSDITHRHQGVSRVILGFAQKINPMYYKVLSILKDKGYNPTSKSVGTRDVKAISICRREEIIRFLGSVRPARLLPKFNPDAFGAMSPVKSVKLIKKKFLGQREVVALSTDTKTYVAEGLASHNCDYDWVVFCSLFGRMIDLPRGFPMYCRDLKQTFDEMFRSEELANVAKKSIFYPKQVDEHNALSDAKWNYQLHKFLEKELQDRGKLLFEDLPNL